MSTQQQGLPLVTDEEHVQWLFDSANTLRDQMLKAEEAVSIFRQRFEYAKDLAQRERDRLLGPATSPAPTQPRGELTGIAGETAAALAEPVHNSVRFRTVDQTLAAVGNRT